MRLQITIPRNTPRSAPLVTSFMYDKTRMTRQEINFPSAHCFLRGLKMFAGFRISPVIPEAGSSSDWLIEDNRLVTKNVELSFDLPFFNVVFYCFNEDDSFDHTLYIDLQ